MKQGVRDCVDMLEFRSGRGSFARSWSRSSSLRPAAAITTSTSGTAAPTGTGRLPPPKPAVRRRRQRRPMAASWSSPATWTSTRSTSACTLLRHVPDLHDRGLRDADRPRHATTRRSLPRLATSWEANADKTEFTFNLDPSRQVRRRLAGRAQRREVLVGAAGQHRRARRPTSCGLKTIDTPDPATVVGHVSAAQLGVPADVNASYLGIVNSKVATGPRRHRAPTPHDRQGRDVVPRRTRPAAGRTSSSPTRRARAELKRNDNYWGPNKPVFPEVIIARSEDSSSQRQQLEQGAADIAMQISADRRAAQGNADVTHQGRRLVNFVYLALSPGRPGGEKLKDADVRKAIREALDYDGAIDALGRRARARSKRRRSPTASPARGPATAGAQPRRGQEAAERRRLADGSISTPRTRRQRLRRRLQPMMQKVQPDLEGDDQPQAEPGRVPRVGRHGSATRASR